ncbi:MAG: hypothetical protein GY761_11695 [Hyphomicrobiales bacterium]|nr:hypothetical protein [Hyphomicrobiales bacterium]
MLVASIIAILFGALTVFSGGSVIFLSEAAQAAGNYVPFVVWFNFLAGFAYMISGIGLYKWRQWGVNLSMVIAVLTLLVFAGLGFHILSGGAYEMRTVIAMTFRLSMWTGIAVLARLAWNKVDEIP